MRLVSLQPGKRGSIWYAESAPRQSLPPWSRSPRRNTEPLLKTINWEAKVRNSLPDKTSKFKHCRPGPGGVG